MLLLFVTSLIWAFSFPLIGDTLKGVDPVFLSAVRLLISLVVFFPFFRTKHLTPSIGLKLLMIGAVQYGIMYIAYLKAYQYLASHEVALLTIFTPIYTTLIHDLITKRFHIIFLVTATMAVIGTAIIMHTKFEQAGLFQGILLIQCSNLCFAFGQVYYRSVMKQHKELSNTQVYALLYAGALIIPALWTMFSVDVSAIHLTTTQMWTVGYLGVVASGLGFFLWNIGARRVDTGALAIFNNLKIPLAITVALLFFNEKANLNHLYIGGGIIVLALAVNEFIVKRMRV